MWGKELGAVLLIWQRRSWYKDSFHCLLKILEIEKDSHAEGEVDNVQGQSM